MRLKNWGYLLLLIRLQRRYVVEKPRGRKTDDYNRINFQASCTRQVHTDDFMAIKSQKLERIIQG